MRELTKYKLTWKQKIEEERQFTVNRIISLCREKKWKKLGITSSSRNYRGIDLIVQQLNEIAEKKKLEMFFYELKPIAYFAESLEEAKQLDGVFFSESYGRSYYSELDKCTELLEENHISIGGVVIIS